MAYYNPRDPRPQDRDMSTTTVAVAQDTLYTIGHETRTPTPSSGESRLAQLAQYLTPYTPTAAYNPLSIDGQLAVPARLPYFSLPDFKDPRKKKFRYMPDRIQVNSQYNNKETVH